MAAHRKETKLQIVAPAPRAVLDPRQEAFLEWLLIPKNMRSSMGVAASKEAYALEIGVAAETLRRWEGLPHFREARMKAVAEGIATPEKVETATERCYYLGFLAEKPVPAYAMLWAQIAGLTQQAPVSSPTSSDRLAAMTDEELAALAAQGAKAELVQRRS